MSFPSNSHTSGIVCDQLHARCRLVCCPVRTEFLVQNSIPDPDISVDQLCPSAMFHLQKLSQVTLTLSCQVFTVPYASVFHIVYQQILIIKKIFSFKLLSTFAYLNTFICIKILVQYLFNTNYECVCFIFLFKLKKKY